jgi:hypothetical protein
MALICQAGRKLTVVDVELLSGKRGRRDLNLANWETSGSAERKGVRALLE